MVFTILFPCAWREFSLVHACLPCSFFFFVKSCERLVCVIVRQITPLYFLQFREKPVSIEIGVAMDFFLCFDRASDISRKKSKISRDFQGQIRGKIGRFRGIFAGKKSKFAEQSADFAGFSREKSQNSQKKRPISREISGGNFAKKQSVKNSRFRWFFFWQISLKSINFASI